MDMPNIPLSQLYCSSCKLNFYCPKLFSEHIRNHLRTRQIPAYMRYIEPYACSRCTKTFDEKGDLFIHQKLHFYEMFFTCTFCRKDCKNKSVLAIHQLQCSQNENAIFRSVESVKEEIGDMNVVPTINLTCTSPQTIRSTNSSSDTTISYTISETDENVSKINISFATMTRKHFGSVNDVPETAPGRDYTCGVCNESFRRKCVLDKHMWKHTIIETPRKQKSSGCPKNTSTDSSKPHLTECLNETPVNVPEHSSSPSEDVFTTRDNVLSSSMKKTSRTKKVYKAKRSYNLRKRIIGEKSDGTRKVSTPVLYFCQQCKKSFKDNYKLKRHYLIHTNNRPYACLKCGKNFTRKDHLKRHSYTHCESVSVTDLSKTKERPFTCNVCERSFTQKSHLKRHSFIHTSDKPHVCENCEQGFIRKYSLVRHMSSCKGLA